MKSTFRNPSVEPPFETAYDHALPPAPAVPRAVWRVGVMVLMVLGLVGSLVLSLLQNSRLAASEEARQRLLLTGQVVEEARGALSDMEAGNRGFLLTGDDAFRRPFHRGRDVFSARYKTLVAATAGHEVQQERLRRIKDNLTSWFRLYNPMIQERQNASSVGNEFPTVEQRAALRRCRSLTEEIEFLLDELLRFEQSKVFGVSSASGAG